MVRLVTALALLLCLSANAFAQSIHSFPEFVVNAPGHELVYLNATSTLGTPEPIVVFFALDSGGLVDISATIPADRRLSLPMNDQQLLGGSGLKTGFLRVTCTTCKVQLVVRPRPRDNSDSELARFWGDPLYINPVP